MSEQHEQCDERNSKAFIPAALDDYGLTADEFRVYARIVRRAGVGDCWEGVDAIAKHCRMNAKTVRKAIVMLCEFGLITCEHREGKTSIIKITKESQWKKPSEVEAIRERLTPTKKGTPTVSTPTVSTPTCLGTPTVSGGTTPTARGRAPLPPEADEGIPLRYSQEGTPLSYAHEENSQEEEGKENQTISNQSEPQTPNKPASLSSNEEISASPQENFRDLNSARFSPAKNNYIHPIDRMEQHFQRQGLFPWQMADGNINPDFIKFLEPQMAQDGSMHPRAKARNHIINCQESSKAGDRLKVQGYWDDFQREQARRREAENTIARQSPHSPPPDRGEIVPPDVMSAACQDMKRKIAIRKAEKEKALAARRRAVT